MKRHTRHLTRPVVLVVALLVGTFGGVLATSGTPADANSNYATAWSGWNNWDYCDAWINHHQHDNYLPIAGTYSGVTQSCLATEAIVYWDYYAVDSGQGGTVTEAWGWEQAEPYMSAHQLCWAPYQCGGWYMLY